MYKSSVVDIAKRLKPSSRNEYEITDLNNVYIKNNDCDVVTLEENSGSVGGGVWKSTSENKISKCQWLLH